MTIQILPARLANQIAAGEVVERPASVIKELVENSLDAGATKIHIEIDKGGAKRIRISDDGCGIAKDELSLALSRHATSKIKDLSDLEAIASLGFRGEALASISSVARLTLTSKPKDQENAWQAFAQGRDMEVNIQPAAHPDGTTIEVCDLFFNTPARRKFLRTEKTEFSHIDEIIRRIALARFDVTFTLVHNGKTIRHYRAAKESSQYLKRVASVCGPKFVEHSIEIECRHDNLNLWGWVAAPSYTRQTNDLCYSYVNGRMMRDKLINHAIRQAYADLITDDGYPAFVLFLELDFKEVDVNVHPAKHEVRFHQGRYIHDFIYSVIHQALQQQGLNYPDMPEAAQQLNEPSIQDIGNVSALAPETSIAGENSHTDQQVAYYGNAPLSTEQGNHDGSAREYVKPLQFSSPHHGRQSVSPAASASYQQLMTPAAPPTEQPAAAISQKHAQNGQVLHIVSEHYALICLEEELRLVSLKPYAYQIAQKQMIQRWQDGIVSQPLLLPVILPLNKEQVDFIDKNNALFERAGLKVNVQTGAKIQIRTLPAFLRDKDVSTCVRDLLENLMQNKASFTESDMIDALTKVNQVSSFTLASANALITQMSANADEQFKKLLYLNSVEVDLTSELSQLK